MSIESHLVSLRTYLEDIAGTQQEILRELQKQNGSQAQPAIPAMEAPWKGYDAMNVAQVLAEAETRNTQERDRMLTYERANKNRKGVIDALENWGQ